MRALNFIDIPFREVVIENGKIVPFSGYFFWQRVKNKNLREEPVRQFILHTLATEYGFPVEEIREGGLKRRGGKAAAQAMHEFATSHLFGVDISRELVRIAQQNARLHDDEYIDARQNDSLTNIEQLGDMQRAHGFRRGGLTAIATNPPFGAPLKDEQTLELFRITRRQRAGRTSVVKSEDKQVLAIDRCLEMLTDEVRLPNGKTIGGRMVIVLPDGVLANSDARVIRTWYREHAILRAVVSLPQHTFMPFGAGVKASVVVFEKKPPHWDDAQDYEVYMARVDDIGYDAKGSDHNCPKCNAHRADAEDDSKAWHEKAKDEIDEIVDDFQSQMNLGWRLD